jgi:hypothetical protein
VSSQISTGLCNFTPLARCVLIWICLLLALSQPHPLHAQAPASTSDLPDAPTEQTTTVAEADNPPPLPRDNFVPAPTYEPPQVPNQSGPPRWWKQSSFDPDAKPDPGYLEHYQWRGLIWQSVEFNVVENGFRVSSDPVMRDILAHRPFWHDWLE